MTGCFDGVVLSCCVRQARPRSNSTRSLSTGRSPAGSTCTARQIQRRTSATLWAKRSERLVSTHKQSAVASGARVVSDRLLLIAAEMDNGVIEASCYRGRVLLSASVQKNVQDPKLLHKGQLPIPQKKIRHPPQPIPFKLRVCVLEGSSLPTINGKKLRVEVSHGLAKPPEKNAFQTPRRVSPQPNCRCTSDSDRPALTDCGVFTEPQIRASRQREKRPRTVVPRDRCRGFIS